MNTSTVHLVKSRLKIAALLLALTSIVTLLIPGDVVLGASHTDLTHQFVAMRAFAADSIRAGDFPFWNPYTYSGQPFLGGLQSALFYPFNAAFLALPIARATNFTIVLHLAIAGWGMAYWVSRRGLHPGAATVAGVALALSGPVLPHVYAGHLSNLCTLAWAPWAFAGLENGWGQRQRSGLVLASAAIALQILAGQIQYVFFFGVAAALCALVVSIADRSARARALPALVGCSLFAGALAAVQLVPGFAAAAESVRSGKLDYDFASVFALPPENLLTAAAPSVFGAMESDVSYWGRCYPWEMSVFVGVSGVLFAVAGLLDRAPGNRSKRDLVIVALLLVLALGSHLPLYRLLYEHVPGFGHFRGMSKFTFPAVLFFLLIVARGIDALIRDRIELRRLALVAVGAGIVLAGGGAVVRAAPDVFRSVYDSIRAEPENDFPAERFAAAEFPGLAARNASGALLIAGAIAVGLGSCLSIARRRARFRWAALAILPLELTTFAATQVDTTPIAVAMPEDLRKFVASNPGDYRALNLLRPNNGYLLGAGDLWGNDPLVLKRYAEFMAFTQGQDPDGAQQNLSFRSIHPLHAMLRCRYLFYLSTEGNSVAAYPNVMPRAVLLSDYRVQSKRDAIFAELTEPSFDPRRRVVLESEPAPRPAVATQPGNVRVLGATSDSLTLEVETPQPAILLVTDLFSRGWRVRSLAESAQASYEVLPANYILRAVPLAAGTHRLHMEYIPPGFVLGAAISIAAGMLWIAGLVIAARRRSGELASAPNPKEIGVAVAPCEL